MPHSQFRCGYPSCEALAIARKWQHLPSLERYEELSESPPVQDFHRVAAVAAFQRAWRWDICQRQPHFEVRVNLRPIAKLCSQKGQGGTSEYKYVLAKRLKRHFLLNLEKLRRRASAILSPRRNVVVRDKEIWLECANFQTARTVRGRWSPSARPVQPTSLNARQTNVK